MVYFTLLLPATCFGSIYSSHLEPKHIVGSNNVKYTINHNNNY